MSSRDLKHVDSHFAFGENWASYARQVDAARIEEAQKGILKLIAAEDIEGRSFLDIGCGSGLHALAAARLGAGRILATDIDPRSVATARTLLSSHACGAAWQVEEISVFDLDPERHGRFDIVYAWGVLHHTGDMWHAVEKAAALVAPDGLLAIALYHTTKCDAFWKMEKRWYSRASPFMQRIARGCFVAAYRSLAVRTGFRKFVADYKSMRGMDFYHDVHDWLGGYPYETALAPDVDRKVAALGFRSERIFAQPEVTQGILGSGCDEYVYRLQGPPHRLAR